MKDFAESFYHDIPKTSEIKKMFKKSIFGNLQTGRPLNLVKLLRSEITSEARQAIYGQVFLTIEELKTFLKNIYTPARTIPQLLGELGQEFQKDYENVITYANRIRDIGTRILEVRSIENRGLIDPNFRASIENTLIDSFNDTLHYNVLTYRNVSYVKNRNIPLKIVS